MTIDASSSSPAVYVPLPGFEDLAPPRPSRRYAGAPRLAHQPPITDPLIDQYVHRALKHGAAPRGVAAYRYALESLLRSARRMAGSEIDLVAVLRDESLLGRALVDDRAFATDKTLSRWTLAQRRSAMRSLAMLMYPELQARLGKSPHQVVDGALRSVAERIGTGDRLTGGASRRRGGDTPSADQIEHIIAAAGGADGFSGLRNQAFFGILAATGTRVTALRQLQGTDCIIMPSGRLRLRIHEKGKSVPREVELPGDHARTLLLYAERFNAFAAERGLLARVAFDTPAPVWRNDPGTHGRMAVYGLRWRQRARPPGCRA